MKASFVIPSYNNAAWLAQAIESVLKQTVKSEIVVVNDGSTDSTKKLLAHYKDQIKVVTNGKPRGRSVARNQGNAVASGDVLFILDSDDMAVPQRVEWTLKKIESGASFVYGSAFAMNSVGMKIREETADVFNLEKAIRTKLNRIVHSTVAYTREFAEKYPYKEGDFSDLGLDDWAQQIEAAMMGEKFDFIAPVVSAYRVLETAVTQTRDPEKVAKCKDEFLSYMRASV